MVDTSNPEIRDLLIKEIKKKLISLEKRKQDIEEDIKFLHNRLNNLCDHNDGD